MVQHLSHAQLALAGGSFEFGPRFWIIVVTVALALAVIAKGIRGRNLAEQSQSSADEPEASMGRADFWGIIDAARTAAGDDPMERPAHLLRALRNMEPDEIARFDGRYREERARADHAELRTAADLMRGGVSDVEFGHFRDWLISEGEDVFGGAMKSADSLAELGKRKVTTLEAFGYSAKRAYKSKANKPLPEPPRPRSIRSARRTSTPWPPPPPARGSRSSTADRGEPERQPRPPGPARTGRAPPSPRPR